MVAKYFAGFFIGVEEGDKLILQHHKRAGSILISDGHSLGYRCQCDGILLLQTALRTPIKSEDEIVTIELPISEVCE